MKLKITLLTSLIACMLQSCNSNEPVIDEFVSQKNTNSSNTIRSIDDAIELAISSKSKFYPTVSRSEISVDKTKIHTVTRKVTSRSQDADTLYYVINFEDNNGYAIVNAQNDGVDVYAVTERGEYDPNTVDDSQPEALNLYLKSVLRDSLVVDSIGTKIPFISGNSNTLLTEYIIERDTVERCIVEPRVKTRWGQTDFFALYCPNACAGCGPVALGQALAAFNLPTSMQFSFTNLTRPFDSATFDWAELKQHNKYYNTEDKFFSSVCEYNVYEYGEDTYSLSHQKIASFLRQLGQLSNATYIQASKIYSARTPTTLSNTLNTAKQFNVKTIDGTSASLTTLSPLPFETYKNAIFIVSGTNTDTQTGHEFIVDGCYYVKVIVSDYSRVAGSSIMTPISSSTFITSYVHINWGWDGISNGYFTTSSTIDASKPVDKDYDEIYNSSEKYATFNYFGIYL